MPQFRILDLPGQQAKDLDVSEGGIVGRDAGVALQIEHPTVSRQHAQLLKNGKDLVLVDMGSANGTRVNGVKLTAPTTLKEGDNIEFGKVMVLYFSKNAPTQMAPSPKASPLSTIEPVGASMPLEALESMLSGLIQILAEPMPLVRQANHISRIFAAMMPTLTQAALLDPCGKLVGSLENGRMLPNDFYGALAGVLGQQTLGALQLDGPALAGLGKQLGLSSVLPRYVVCIPIASKSFYGGALYLEAETSFFNGEVADAMRLGAGVLGPLLDRAPQDPQLMINNEDLRLAQRIQKTLLRTPPSSADSLNIAVQYIPHYVVGGDFYDFAALPKKEYAFILGDVSGKGVSASLVMAQVVATARENYARCNGPAALLTRMNAALSEMLEPGVFATAAAIYINAEKGSCRLALAGHNPPVIRTKSGKVLELGFDPGAPLGATSKLEPKELRVMLAVGDAMILNTDGLEEAERADPTGKSKKLELFGEQRRNEVIERSPGAQNLAIALREAVFSFSGTERSSDDLTIMIIERANAA